jgi:hypothetical protein
MSDQTPTNPFEDLLNQISDLMHLAQEKANLPIDHSKVPEAQEKLQKLRTDIELFVKVSREVVIASGVEPEEIDKRLKGTSKDISEEGKRLLAKAKKLKEQALSMKEFYQVPESVNKTDEGKAVATPPVTKKIDDAKYPKRRKSKFKRFGGNKDWKPL